LTLILDKNKIIRGMEEAVNIIVAMKGLRSDHVNPTMHIVVHMERLRLTIVKCLANVSIGASSIPVN
jgi:hypothetical protein